LTLFVGGGFAAQHIAHMPRGNAHPADEKTTASDFPYKSSAYEKITSDRRRSDGTNTGFP
jgi:hypothetical protein